MAKYTIRDWDETRAAFATSIMVNTALSSLAQNLDGPDWPLKGKDETPAKYIDLGYEEVIEYLAMKGQPVERILERDGEPLPAPQAAKEQKEYEDSEPASELPHPSPAAADLL